MAKKISSFVIRKRLIVFLVFGMIVFTVILFRLAYVQLVIGDDITDKAKDLWSRNIPFEPKRGEIKDRNGEVLATNVSMPSVYVVPRQVVDKNKTAADLAKILEADEKKILERIEKNSMIERIPEGRKITPEKAKEIKKLNLPGVFIAEDSKRFYPFGSELSQVLGFAGADNQGLVGLEYMYDEELKGDSGSVKFFSDAKGGKLPELSDNYSAPINGNDLWLTIDNRVQQVIEKELDIAVQKYNPDSIIALAVNPNNGEILGMSSRPNFDPGNYQAYSQEIYNRNLPIWSTYEPGSTFKIITLAAALEEGKVDLAKDKFYDKGSVEVAGARLKCWKRGGHGDETFLEVVQNSCNPGFVELGERLGKEKLFQYVYDFGFGKKTGVDLLGEGTGIMFKPEQIGPVEQATTAFGQGVSVTPIQQVMAVSAAINGGILYKPYIAKEVVDSKTGDVVTESIPEEKRRVISAETSAQVRDALEHVVAQGTGRGAFVDGYRVGGKTGTAQKAVDGRYLENNYIVSFIGFAPADNPEVVIYVAVDNPKGEQQFGGTIAAPIVGNIMSEVLPELGVEKRETQIEKIYRWPELPTIEAPNFVGMNKDDLARLEYNLVTEVNGEGSRVISQTPKAGTKITEGSTVRLILGD